MGRRGAPPQTGGMPANHPLRVYLVEDSAPVLERLQHMVQAAGARAVGHAAGADEAVRGILAERPDLVLLDLNLAQGTGLDVLRALRLEAPLIDVYVLSNYALAPYRELAAHLGARGYFDKTNEYGRVMDLITTRAARH